MDTKLKGDIAEQTTLLKALHEEWEVLKPVGDRLPYDLVLVVGVTFVKVQVKAAWFNKKTKNYMVDSRRSKTNRRISRHEKYKDSDFDFAIIYIENLDLFYIMPSKVFNKYAGPINLVEETNRQRKPSSAKYRNAWHLISARKK